MVVGGGHSGMMRDLYGGVLGGWVLARCGSYLFQSFPGFSLGISGGPPCPPSGTATLTVRFNRHVQAFAPGDA